MPAAAVKCVVGLEFWNYKFGYIYVSVYVLHIATVGSLQSNLVGETQTRVYSTLFVVFLRMSSTYVYLRMRRSGSETELLTRFTPSAAVDMSKEKDWQSALGAHVPCNDSRNLSRPIFSGMLDWDSTNIVFTKRTLIEFLK